METEANRLSETVPQRIFYSQVALRQLDEMTQDEQSILVEGLVRAYVKVLSLLNQIRYSTFIPANSFSALQLLAASDVTTLDLDGFSVRVQICHQSFDWHIVSIGTPGSLKHYKIKTRI